MRRISVPTIMSESGRALASHHAVMVFDVLTKYAPGTHANLFVTSERLPSVMCLPWNVREEDLSCLEAEKNQQFPFGFDS